MEGKNMNRNRFKTPGMILFSLSLIFSSFFNLLDLPAAKAAGQTPYGGTAWAVPGQIEAENYDTGGEGIAYHDTTTGNSLGAYRTDDVDIKTSNDTGGGYDRKWQGPEWWMGSTSMAHRSTSTSRLTAASPQ
jgi:hypothetical protein